MRQVWMKFMKILKYRMHEGNVRNQKKKKVLDRIKNIFRKDSGKEVADKLEALGYFAYAHPSEIGSLKNEISIAYEEYGMLSSAYAFHNGKHYPKDFRLYSLDNEALFQKGGYSKYLSEIQPTFKKLHIPFMVDEEKEEYSESKGFTHSISINGIKYPILKNFKNYSRGSAVATKKFIETINDVLKRQSSDERVYPVSRGLDGQIVFLTKSSSATYRSFTPIMKVNH